MYTLGQVNTLELAETIQVSPRGGARLRSRAPTIIAPALNKKKFTVLFCKN